MRSAGENGPDNVAGRYGAARHHDSHNPGLAYEVPFGVALEHRGHETGQKLVELPTGVSQAGHFHNSVVADDEPGARRKIQEIDALRGDVFTHVTGLHREALPF